MRELSVHGWITYTTDPYPSPFITQSHTTYLTHVWPRQPRRNRVKVIAQRGVFAALADVVDVALLHREVVHNARRTEDAGEGAGRSAGVLAGVDEADAARDGACDLVGGLVGEERDVVGVVLPVLAVVLVLHLYMCMRVFAGVYVCLYTENEQQQPKSQAPVIRLSSKTHTHTITYKQMYMHTRHSAFYGGRWTPCSSC